jgi:hypothetical protein
VTKAKIAEQAAQIKKMRQLIQGAISEADRDIAPAVLRDTSKALKLT